ncbi:hypothetical protein OC861_005604 [Tilletia horrida]|nr:hypothetical protein OC861_005604 [Tilletia horrida]
MDASQLEQLRRQRLLQQQIHYQQQLQQQQQQQQRIPLPVPSSANGSYTAASVGPVRPNPLASLMPMPQAMPPPTLLSNPARQQPVISPHPAVLVPAARPVPAAVPSFAGVPPMPTYLGAAALNSTGAQPAASTSSNSPFLQLQAQNANSNASFTPSPLFPHLQWHTSRGPANAPSVLPEPVGQENGGATAVLNPGDLTTEAAITVKPDEDAQEANTSMASQASASGSKDKSPPEPAGNAEPQGSSSKSASKSSSSKKRIRRPASLPEGIIPRYSAGEELDSMFPDCPLIKEPLKSWTGLHIVASKRVHYKLSRFHPYQYAEQDQGDAFWMPKNFVDSRLMKEWRDGRKDRAAFKEEHFRKLVEMEARSSKENARPQKHQKRKVSTPAPVPSDDSDAPTSGPAPKKPRLDEPDVKSEPVPSSSNIADEPQEAPAATDTADEHDPIDFLPSLGELLVHKKRGRPKGSKNKEKRVPTRAEEVPPEEVDEIDELDEDESAADIIVDVSALPASIATAKQRKEIIAAQQDDKEQEVMISKAIKVKPEPIQNPLPKATAPFLEISATKLPRLPAALESTERVEPPEVYIVSSSPEPAPASTSDATNQVATEGDNAEGGSRAPSSRPQRTKRVEGEEPVARGATSSRPVQTARATRGRGGGKGGPASHVRAVTEAEFKGLLGPRTGASLEPTPPPAGTSNAGRALRSNAPRRGGAGADDAEDEGRGRDASSPVEEFLSQPQAIISADELARRAIPRVGGWIVPVAPPRPGLAAAAAASGSQSAKAEDRAQAQGRQGLKRASAAAPNFAVVVPVRPPGPPQGEFGREEQLVDAYTQLRDRHADAATIHTPQDLAQALDRTGVLNGPRAEVKSAGPSSAVVSITAPNGTPALRVQQTVPTQAPVPTNVSVFAPRPSGPNVTPAPPATNPMARPVGVADLEHKVNRSMAIPSFLKPELDLLVASLTVNTNTNQPGAYVCNIHLSRIPRLATKACWWLDLDVGKIEEGGSGYTVILNYEVQERTLTTHGMSRALVKHLNKMPSVSPWYDAHGRRWANDGTLIPDGERVEADVQTLPLQDAQSLALDQYQTHIVDLNKELVQLRAQLEAEETSKQEIEEQSNFRQQQYDQASTRAVELSREVTTLEARVQTLERQLNEGLSAQRLFANTASEKYQADLKELREQNELLRSQAKRTDALVRRKAAEYDDLRKLELLRFREKEKVMRASGQTVPVASGSGSASALQPSTPTRPLVPALAAAATTPLGGLSTSIAAAAAAAAPQPARAIPPTLLMPGNAAQLMPPPDRFATGGPASTSSPAGPLDQEESADASFEVVGEDDHAAASSMDLLDFDGAAAPATQANHFI